MSRRLFVTNLSSDVTADDLHHLFASFGRPLDVQIMDPWARSASAVVQMSTLAQGDAAIAGLNGRRYFNGRSYSGNLLIVARATALQERDGRRQMVGPMKIPDVLADPPEPRDPIPGDSVTAVEPEANGINSSCSSDPTEPLSIH